MKPAVLFNPLLLKPSLRVKYLRYFFVFTAGFLAPLGFAPFHLPGVTILSVAFLYFSISSHSIKEAFFLGFLYGLGFFGLGVSWVIISIHDYGNLNYFLAGFVTLGFIAYLSLYPALVSTLFKFMALTDNKLINGLLFSVLWFFGEYLRSTLFTGFPWLLIGTSEIDTPLKFLFPVLGIYGVGLVCTFACTLLIASIREQSITQYFYIALFVLLIIGPSALKNSPWTTIKTEPISVGVIQANLAMRNKWDDNLFWSLLHYYEKTINTLLDKQLIILPESAIPLPANYLNEYLLRLHHKTLTSNSSLVLGILQPTDDSETNFYNSIIGLGHAQGTHIKRQLVPFGEYIPQPFIRLNQWMNLPAPNIAPGKKKQSLVKIAKHHVASLICYEIAYPELIRQQMPVAEWIISISDNGWFGHSFASYQQLQMAQVLSALTGRFQVVANNDGLSSVINNQGDLIDSLPPFSSGILQSEVFSSQGSTPWIEWGNYPSLFFCAIIFLLMFFLRLKAFQQQ
jgi:apolipoprotein N-acyltransferase